MGWIEDLHARAAETIDLEAEVRVTPRGSTGCGHLDALRTVRPGTAGCAECLESGSGWVHLRLCMTCGHVGCCDSSPNRHARRHFRESGHAVVRSLEPGESWAWCFADEVYLM